MDRRQDFFAFARARHQIYLNRQAGMPPPWTEDAILQTYKFTNVFRELDRTTKWFRENVREKLRDKPEVLLATALFRWFNRTRVGEAIFCQKTLWPGKSSGTTAFEIFLETGEAEALQHAINTYSGPPYVTGAYMIKTPKGMKKLDGVLWCIDNFNKKGYSSPFGSVSEWDWRRVGKLCLREDGPPIHLQEVWEWLCQFEFLGPFLSYEIVTDLRHTDLLCNAPDIDTWTNPGPGANRGVSRLLERGGRADRLGVYRPARVPQAECLEAMLALLQDTRNPTYWPSDWPVWELRDVEHCCCEFDKYERVRLGQGKPKARYR